MGGDDLASDDEYLFDSSINPRSTAISSSDDEASFAKEAVPAAKKRKNTKQSADDAVVPTSSKKRKKNKNNTPKSKSGLIIEAGRGIALDGADAQATFFGTCYSHAVKMNVSAGDQPDDTDNESKNPEDFVFQPYHFYAAEDIDADTNEKQHTDLSMYLKQSNVIPSMKRLKNWKHNHSPMILIISLSARRCVELQKQLSYLKLPVAKLFAKHMNVEDQVDMLKGGKSGDKGGGGKGKKSSRCFGIGVGTPGRLLTLLRHGNDGTVNSGALKLNHTELIIIDCHQDGKGFTVCTLKDTAKELMEFMKEGVVSELEKRKDKIKLALF